MIKIIYGKKGTGKTTLIIDSANSVVDDSKGNIVFITDNKRYMYNLHRKISFIDTAEYNINTEDLLLGFVKGVVAANNDNEFLFIDGVARIAGKELCELEKLFRELQILSDNSGVYIEVTCSADRTELPDFVKMYI